MRSTELCLCALFALVVPGAAAACTTYAIRGLVTRINEGPLSISLLLERDIELFIYGPDLSELVNRKDKQWHDISTTRNGSMNCVTSPTLWVGEKCSERTYWLILRSNVTTLWRLGCSSGSERCSQLLETVFLGLDALPTTLHWKPQDVSVGLWVYGKEFKNHFSVTNSWHDLSISPGGDESLCTVHSTSLNFSVPCSQNATEKDFLRFGEKGIGQSLFALDCVQNSVLGGWVVPIVLLFLGTILLLLPVALLRVRKRRRASKGVFHPEEDQRYVALRSPNPPMPPHDKGGRRHLLDRQTGKSNDPEEDEEHVYCYMDMAMLRRQLERDRQAAAQARQQEKDPDAASVFSHDSRNSLYDELKAIEARHNRDGKGDYEYEEEDQDEEEDRDVEEEEGEDEEDRYEGEEDGEDEEDWDDEEEEGEDEEDRIKEEEEGEEEEDRRGEEEEDRSEEEDGGRVKEMDNDEEYNSDEQVDSDEEEDKDNE
ncbi:uncharacterized protein LOC134775928 [Penaeus indicus]|uniref:uncharacterized protein LOC134775928 n=1 Tax=Penaeus indicus TaxID=29960 RepID=UPI00300C0BAD